MANFPTTWVIFCLFVISHILPGDKETYYFMFFRDDHCICSICIYKSSKGICACIDQTATQVRVYLLFVFMFVHH